MTIRLAILADDLTGACDTGASFTRRAPVPVTVFPDAVVAGLVSVLDTESRAVERQEARWRIRQAARSVPAAELLFKKIDSALRGWIADELAELMDATQRAALVCPAFPAQGRAVVGGILTVHGVPVGATALGRDPDFRVGDDEIARALAPAARSVDSCSLDALRHGRLAIATTGIVVSDAETDADLDAIVSVALRSSPPPLLVGSAGLAAAVARHLHLDGPPPAIPPGLRWLIVAGSLHPATRSQVTRMKTLGARVLTSPDEPRADRFGVAAELARDARKAIDNGEVDAVAVIGGDTTVALYRELDTERVELLGAPAPGLALGHLCRGGRRLPILTKAGAFGAADVFERLLS